MIKEIVLGLASFGLSMSSNGPMRALDPGTAPNGSLYFPEQIASLSYTLPFSANQGFPSHNFFGRMDFVFVQSNSSEHWVNTYSGVVVYPQSVTSNPSWPSYWAYPSWVGNSGYYLQYSDAIFSSYLYGAPYQSTDWQSNLAWNSSDLLNSIQLRVYFVGFPDEQTGRLKNFDWWFSCANDTLAHLGSNNLMVNAELTGSLGKSTIPFMNSDYAPFPSYPDGVDASERFNEADIVGFRNVWANGNFPTSWEEVGRGAYNPLTYNYQQPYLNDFYRSNLYQQRGFTGSTGKVSRAPISGDASILTFNLNVGLLEFVGTTAGGDNLNYQNGFNDGYNNGIDAGYSEGFKQGASSVEIASSFSWLTSALNAVTGVFGLQLFPGFSLGSLVMIPLAGAVLIWVIKLLRG